MKKSKSIANTKCAYLQLQHSNPRERERYMDSLPQYFGSELNEKCADATIFSFVIEIN